MSFLCTTINRKVSYHQCVNECQYFFKSACIDKMNEAYQQGRADAESEHKKMCESCIHKVSAEDIEQIRADAIDECIKLVGGNIKTITGIVFDNSIPIHDRALGRMAKNKLIEELVEQLEQLKEQNND